MSNLASKQNEEINQHVHNLANIAGTKESRTSELNKLAPKQKAMEKKAIKDNLQCEQISPPLKNKLNVDFLNPKKRNIRTPLNRKSLMKPTRTTNFLKAKQLFETITTNPGPLVKSEIPNKNSADRRKVTLDGKKELFSSTNKSSLLAEKRSGKKLTLELQEEKTIDVINYYTNLKTPLSAKGKSPLFKVDKPRAPDVYKIVHESSGNSQLEMEIISSYEVNDEAWEDQKEEKTNGINQHPKTTNSEFISPTSSITPDVYRATKSPDDSANSDYEAHSNTTIGDSDGESISQSKILESTIKSKDIQENDNLNRKLINRFNTLSPESSFDSKLNIHRKVLITNKQNEIKSEITLNNQAVQIKGKDDINQIKPDKVGKSNLSPIKVDQTDFNSTQNRDQSFSPIITEAISREIEMAKSDEVLISSTKQNPKGLIEDKLSTISGNPDLLDIKQVTMNPMFNTKNNISNNLNEVNMNELNKENGTNEPEVKDKIESNNQDDQIKDNSATKFNQKQNANKPKNQGYNFSRFNNQRMHQLITKDNTFQKSFEVNNEISKGSIKTPPVKEGYINSSIADKIKAWDSQTDDNLNSAQNEPINKAIEVKKIKPKSRNSLNISPKPDRIISSAAFEIKNDLENEKVKINAPKVEENQTVVISGDKSNQLESKSNDLNKADEINLNHINSIENFDTIIPPQPNTITNNLEVNQSIKSLSLETIITQHELQIHHNNVSNDNMNLLSPDLHTHTLSPDLSKTSPEIRPKSPARIRERSKSPQPRTTVNEFNNVIVREPSPIRSDIINENKLSSDNEELLEHNINSKEVNSIIQNEFPNPRSSYLNPKSLEPSLNAVLQCIKHLDEKDLENPRYSNALSIYSAMMDNLSNQSSPTLQSQSNSRTDSINELELNQNRNDKQISKRTIQNNPAVPRITTTYSAISLPDDENNKLSPSEASCRSEPLFLHPRKPSSIFTPAPPPKSTKRSVILDDEIKPILKSNPPTISLRPKTLNRKLSDPGTLNTLNVDCTPIRKESLDHFKNHSQESLNRSDSISSKLSHIIEELISTEESYYNDLILLRDVYMLPAKNSPNEFSAKDIHVIFINVEEIIEYSKRLILFLKNAYLDGENKAMIGQLIIQEHTNLQQVYSQYFKMHETSSSYLQDMIHRFPDVVVFLEKCDQNLKGKSNAWDISSLLIKPIQRFLKYPLLLKEMVSKTPNNHPDYSNLLEASKLIQNTADNYNEFKKRKEAIEKIIGHKSKKSEVDLRHGINKKLIRGAQQLRKIAGVKVKIMDKQYDSLYQQFVNLENNIREFWSNVQSWSVHYETYLNFQIQLAKAYTEVYYPNSSNNTANLQLYSLEFLKAITHISKQSIEYLDDQINNILYDKVHNLCQLFNKPTIVMKKRDDKLFDYDQHVKNKTKENNNSLAELSKSYELINQQLIDELPKFIELISKMFVLIITQFANIQKELTNLPYKQLYPLLILFDKNFNSNQNIIERYQTKMDHLPKPIPFFDAAMNIIGPSSLLNLDANVIVNKELRRGIVIHNKNHSVSSSPIINARNPIPSHFYRSKNMAKSNSVDLPMFKDSMDNGNLSTNEINYLENNNNNSIQASKSNSELSSNNNLDNSFELNLSFKKEVFKIHQTKKSISHSRSNSNLSFTDSMFNFLNNNNNQSNPNLSNINPSNSNETINLQKQSTLLTNNDLEPPNLINNSDIESIYSSTSSSTKKERKILFYCKALFPYKANSVTELSLIPGKNLIVYKTADSWWYGKIIDSNIKGWFPKTYCKKLD